MRLQEITFLRRLSLPSAQSEHPGSRQQWWAGAAVTAEERKGVPSLEATVALLPRKEEGPRSRVAISLGRQPLHRINIIAK